MIDSHCHLNFGHFVNQSALVAMCQQAGISRLLVPATQLSDFDSVLALKHQFTCIDIALGLHPYFLQPDAASQLDELKTQIRQHQAQLVAVGEIGIDAVIGCDLALQQHILEAQLQLAAELRKPVILHHRKSHHLIMQSLQRSGFEQGGVVHAFSGSKQQAFAYIDKGFMLGFGGTITYPRAQKTIETLRALPDDAILLETDAPDMPLNGQQGRANSPLNLGLVAAAVAAIRGQSEQEVSRFTDRNYVRLFGHATDKNHG